ncbi:MAG: hypothetical protein ACK4LQ_04190 [Pararhodobacter sp.]
MHTHRPLITQGVALLMALTVLVHVFLGGPEYHLPYQRELEDPLLRAMAAVLWHAVTVVLAVLAAGLVWLAHRPDPALEAVISGIQIGFAALFLWYGAVQLGSLVPMPQWIIFLLLPALTRLGQWQRPGAARAGAGQ